jgi:hypothetical protein
LNYSRLKYNDKKIQISRTNSPTGGTNKSQASRTKEILNPNI